MKTLSFTLVVLFLLPAAFAASFDRIDRLSNERLMRAAELHQDLGYLYDNCGTHGYLQIAARRVNEKWENTVRQAVYYTNTGVNAPVSGVKAFEVDIKTEEGMRLFLQSAFSAQAVDARLPAHAEEQIRAFRTGLRRLRGTYRYFVGGHQNSLGPTHYAVIVDLNMAEVLVLQPFRCK